MYVGLLGVDKQFIYIQGIREVIDTRQDGSELNDSLARK
jgi:hypothetical protein